MTDEVLLQRLDEEAGLLAETVRSCDPSAPVPGLDWDARTVATHTGAVHRWAADIVVRRLLADETGGSGAFWPSGLADPLLPGWLDEGASTLVAALRAAPPALECFTFIPDVAPRSFWIRRQAHETAIHRADMEAAAGRPVTEVDASFAQDGLGEILGAFATEPGFATDRPGRLLLDASDGPAWLVTFGGDRNIVESGDLSGVAPSAVVTGSSAELYLWAWNRPSPALATGDVDVLTSWRAIRVQ